MKDSLTFTDNRSGKQYEFPILDGAIAAKSLQKVRASQSDQGVVSYDPGYQNTANTVSHITYIDGHEGSLLYRGYPIQDLASHSDYLEVAFLLVNGELPGKEEYALWRARILEHVVPHPTALGVIQAFPADAHPMGVLISALGALGTAFPDGKNVLDARNRQLQLFRVLGQLPSLAANILGRMQGQDVPAPDASHGYIGNFLSMTRNFGLQQAEPHPVIRKAMNVLFILHADHEQNCSTAAMRAIASSQADPYSAMAGATAALYGPLHGGANEAVLEMLSEIGGAGNVQAFLEKVIRKEALLMGFGHRVYRNMDPRATLIKKLAYEVFDVTGNNPLIEVAKALETAALDMEYFQARRLYPNVDFYSGITYQALGIPTEFYTVLFALARTAGWLAHWIEHMEDPAQKIARPKQIYRGPEARDYVALNQR